MEGILLVDTVAWVCYYILVPPLAWEHSDMTDEEHFDNFVLVLLGIVLWAQIYTVDFQLVLEHFGSFVLVLVDNFVWELVGNLVMVVVSIVVLVQLNILV